MKRTLRSIAPTFAILVPILLIPPAAMDAATIDLDWSIGTHHGTTVIMQGDTVRWTWTDSSPHTVTATTGLFNSPLMTGAGSQFEFTFTDVDTVPYFCAFHGALAMDGTIQVDPTTAVDGATWARIKNLYR